MKRRIRGRLQSPAIVVAILALVAGVTGAAVASPSAKKVTTKKVKKIADKEIAKKAPGLSVAHADTADTATNANAADTATNANAVGGQALANIAIGRSDEAGAPCDPIDTTFLTCASVTMTLPHEGRVLLIGTAGQYAFTSATSSGNCRMQVDGVNAGGAISVGNQTTATDFGVTNRAKADGFSDTTVRPPVSAGEHTFAFQCNETETDIEFENPQLSAVLLGSG